MPLKDTRDNIRRIGEGPSDSMSERSFSKRPPLIPPEMPEKRIPPMPELPAAPLPPMPEFPPPEAAPQKEPELPEEPPEGLLADLTELARQMALEAIQGITGDVASLKSSVQGLEAASGGEDMLAAPVVVSSHRQPVDEEPDIGEHDHSFHFESTGTDAGNVSDGYYRVGDGTGVEITPATLSDTTTRYYWVKVNWTSSYTTPTVTWENNATGFPTTSAKIWIYPIYTFDSDGVCFEHRSTDIQLPEVYIPATETAYKYVGYDSSGDATIAYPVWNSASP